jgi:hypothetical protein
MMASTQVPSIVNLKPEINPYLEIFSETGDLLLSEPKSPKPRLADEHKKTLYELQHGKPFKLASDPLELKELNIKANLLKRPNSPNKTTNYKDTPQIINRKKSSKKLQKHNGVFVTPCVHAKKKINSLIEEWKDKKIKTPTKLTLSNTNNSVSPDSIDTNIQILDKIDDGDNNFINIETEKYNESLSNNNKHNNSNHNGSHISYSSSIFRNVRSAPLLSSLQQPKIGSAKSPISLVKNNNFNDSSVDRDITIALKALSSSFSLANSKVEESPDNIVSKLLKLRAIQDQNSNKSNELINSTLQLQSNILENKNKNDKKLKPIINKNKKSIRKESPPKKGSAMEYSFKRKQQQQQNYDIHNNNNILKTASILTESINDNISGLISPRYELGDQNNEIKMFNITNKDKNSLSKNGNKSTKKISILTNDKMVNCVTCCKEGKLWCYHCALGYCYSCWGLVDHHSQSDAHRIYSKVESNNMNQQLVVHQGLRPVSPQLSSSTKNKINSEFNEFAEKTNDTTIKSNNIKHVSKTYANNDWADFANATTYMHALELKNLKETVKEFDIK